MTIININATQPSIVFSIGRRGENEVTQVNFDYGAWVREFGAGVVTLLVKRSADASAYPVNLTTADNVAAWLVTATDTEYVGRGRLEFKYTVDEQVKKSVLFGCNVAEDIGAPSSTPPDPYETWLDTLTDLEAATLQNAQDAAGSASAAAAAQSAVENMTVSAETLAAGSDATVTKTEVGGVVNLAFGIPKGDKGQKGNTGAKGEDGAPGEDGYSPTVTVTEITGGHQVTITDVDGDHTFDVMDGTGGGGGTSNYNDLSNKPQINSVTLSGNKSLADLGIAAASAVPAAATSAPSDLGTAAVGDSTKYAKEDHVHKMPSASDVGAIAAPGFPTAGDVLTYDGNDSAWKAAAAPTEIFICTYGTTTFSQINAALNAGKLPVCAYAGYCYPLTQIGLGGCAFGCVVGNTLVSANCTSSDVWSVNSLTVLPAPSSPTGGDALVYDSNDSAWRAAALSASDVGAIAAPASPSAGDVLTYSSGEWTAAAPASVPSASSADPLMDGTKAAGSSTEYARADHVHPTDTSRQSTANIVTTTPCTSERNQTAKYYAASAAWAWMNKIVPGYFSTGPNQNGNGWAVGDYCNMAGVLYRCTTANNHEAFNVSHWTVVTDISKDLMTRAIQAPSSPSVGDFLVYTSNGWAAQSLSTWQGGSY